MIGVDLDSAHQVELKFPGGVKGAARQWLLTGKSFTANNELEHEPQVAIQQSELPAFKSGTRLTLPACSALALQWQSAQ